MTDTSPTSQWDYSFLEASLASIFPFSYFFPEKTFVFDPIKGIPTGELYAIGASNILIHL